MQHNLLEVVTTQQLTDSGGNVVVAGAVGAVAANLVLVGNLAVQGVTRGGFRQALEESGVENNHVRHIRQQLASHADTG